MEEIHPPIISSQNNETNPTHPSEPREDAIQRNFKNNNEKFLIFNFLSNVTRIEILIDKLQNHLFWVGILEYFAFIVLLILFIAKSSGLGKMWFFIFHIFRGAIGIIILCKLPKTHQVIDKFNSFETENLDEIQSILKKEYSQLLSSQQKTLKPLLISYFILTLISCIVDILLFCVISPDFGKKGDERNFFILIFAVLVFLFTDFIYFFYFSSFKNTFPPEENIAIKKALMGFFSELKQGIANGFGVIKKKLTKKDSRDAGEDPGQNNNQGESGNVRIENGI